MNITSSKTNVYIYVYICNPAEPNCEYVISLRARNEVGDGPLVYSNVRTREEAPLETSSPLVPPVGLKAVVLSSKAVVVYWTDTTLSKSQVYRTIIWYDIYLLQ